MRDVRCLVGRHQWESVRDKDGQPYEKCSRPACTRRVYPDDGSRWSAQGPVGPSDGGGGGFGAA